jgi:transposase
VIECPRNRRLAKVPGINVVAAQHLLAGIGARMEAIPTARQLASWAGLCPGRQESAGESKSDGSPKGNRFVRGLVRHLAHSASQTKGSYWESPYQRWVRRMPPAKALWAVAHRLSRLIWKLLGQAVEYEERGPRQLDAARPKARMKRLRTEFRRHRYEVSFTPAHGESMG